MKVKLDGVRRISVIGEYIRLDALLKFSSVAMTGGEAKVLIKGGDVFVDGKQCIQRGHKIRPGNVVRCFDETLVVVQGGLSDADG